MKNLPISRASKLANRKIYIVMVSTALFLGGCASGFEAMYDHDRAHDFSAYQTFAWISPRPMTVGPTNRAPSPLLEPRIMAAIEDALRSKGYTKDYAVESADFVLAFTVGSRDEIRVDSHPTMAGGYGYYGRPVGWGGAYYGYGTETTVRQYTEGMLAVDVFDVKERKPVWHGVATKSISKSDREDQVGTVKAAVDTILAGFPPP
jgi:hypothetical protein